MDVDDREHPVIAQELQQAGACITRLQAVDYCWQTPHGLAVIQRKSLPDAITSIKSGVLDAELYAALSQRAAWVFLLLELEHGQICTGDQNTLIAGGWPTSFHLTGLLNYLASVQRYGVMLHLSPDIRLTARVIAGLQDWTLKPYHSSLAKPPAAIGPQQLMTLMTIPGVSAHRAALLLAWYRTLQEVMQAEVQDLQAIPGIGRATAERLHEYWQAAWREQF